MVIFITAVVEIMLSLITSCNGVTLVDYFFKSMHYSVAESSNMVTNFLGTAYLLSIIWGFISDSYITRFTTFLVSGTLQLMV
ncbi:putative proton-dependent oligopeptide transporter family [Medicago truncatula]|uniref:Putative proton-dependent oligopeptide transporter family n=1 Tax=Medicago truncatula TaxID=3880 RepID=A0A396H426_MEDTR|nr:putative proton-dependent oligopeptide transporter family [Medicago truncatula]RHN45716.1 putative proton-dependent oligopeptide transporter family [Medicago truncatula]